MGLASTISEGLAPVVDLVYPPRCALCGDAIARHGGLCVGCWGELAIPGQPSCNRCSRPFGSDTSQGEMTCAPCLESPPRHAGIAAGTLYNDASRKLILAFKHGGQIGLASMLAGLISAQLPESDASQEPLLVPVPLHRWRLWRRGFNQAAMLAKELEKRGKGKTCIDALVRVTATPSLGGLGKSARRRILASAIAVRPSRKSMIQGRSVILVDDVMTSGATSDACVSALLRAGAKDVRIACVARVLDEAL